MSDTILIPKDTPDWQSILNDVQSARNTSISAKNDAISAKNNAEDIAADIQSFGGIDGSVRSESNLPSSTGSGEFYYVVNTSSYYEDTGSGSIQGGWVKINPAWQNASNLNTGKVPDEQIPENLDKINPKSVSNDVYADRFVDGSLTAGIKEAQQYAKNKGFERYVLHLPEGVHKLHRRVDIDTDVIINANKTVLEWPDNQSKYDLSQDASATDTSIELVDASGLKVGWEMALLDDSIATKNFLSGGGQGVQKRIIQSINGNTVTFNGQIGNDLQTSENAFILHGFEFINITGGVDIFGILGLDFDGLSGQYQGPTYQDVQEGVDWINSFIGHDIQTKNFFARDCTFIDYQGEVFGVDGDNGIYDHCTFINCGDAIHLGNPGKTQIKSCYFEDCYFGFHSSLNLFNI